MVPGPEPEGAERLKRGLNCSEPIAWDIFSSQADKKPTKGTLLQRAAAQLLNHRKWCDTEIMFAMLAMATRLMMTLMVVVLRNCGTQCDI